MDLPFLVGPFAAIAKKTKQIPKQNIAVLLQDQFNEGNPAPRKERQTGVILEEFRSFIDL